MNLLKIPIILLLLIFAGVVVAGCGDRNIRLSDDGYNTGASLKNIKGYKDTQINLGSFYNNAAKAKRYAYFSTDKSVSYSTNSLLPDYMWYCFKKAFTEIGMLVNETDEAPSLSLIINDINDTGLKCDINLYKDDGLEYVKELIVTMPAVSGTADSDPTLLEKKAYDMMDAVIAALLNDKEFKTSLSKAPAVAVDKKIKGTLVGIVKAVDTAANEIIVGSGRIANMVSIGDTIYAETDGGRINMEVSFPMQTIARCRILEKDRKSITKIQKGDMVYK
ncbi:MAG: hypothetical protein JXN64_05255 [Spirochaetes bacterium]|nr:hypothetical protein [Spirochaetota bacterium]